MAFRIGMGSGIANQLMDDIDQPDPMEGIRDDSLDPLPLMNGNGTNEFGHRQLVQYSQYVCERCFNQYTNRGDGSYCHSCQQYTNDECRHFCDEWGDFTIQT